MQVLVEPNEDPVELLIFAAVEAPQEKQGILTPRWAHVCRICDNAADRDDLAHQRESREYLGCQVVRSCLR